MTGSFIYSCMDEQQTAAANCPTESDKIPTQEATERIMAYQDEMVVIKSRLDRDTVKSPYNLSFVGLELRKCETLELFKANPDGNAYIILTLEDKLLNLEDPGSPTKQDSTEKIISAVISDKNIFDKDGNPNPAAIATATFFDFIDPCPPFCGGGR